MLFWRAPRALARYADDNEYKNSRLEPHNGLLDRSREYARELSSRRADWQVSFRQKSSVKFMETSEQRRALRQIRCGAYDGE